MNISQLTINNKITDALLKCGYDTLTPVQSAVLEPALAGKDLFVRSQTGSGKTMAFAIPLVDRLTTTKGVEVLVICPTRELAQQVASETRKLTRKLGDEMVNTIYGGAPIHKQISTLKSGRTKIVVGTPGRIIDHIKRGTLYLSRVSSVVLDEADEMLNMGFLEDIQSILEHVPAQHQTLLFSATYPANIVKLANKYMKDATKIEIGVDNASLSTITQEHVHVDRRLKTAVLVDILNTRHPTLTIVFCNTKSMTETLAKLLRDNGFRASALNGDMKQSLRTKMMRNIKEGKSNILVATDVAARGIDIKDVSHIINYDIPNNSEFYLHRIGRTARAGKQGTSIAITTTKEQLRKIAEIARETKSTITRLSTGNLVAIASTDIDTTDKPLVAIDVKAVDKNGNAISVIKSQPKSSNNKEHMPKGKDKTKRTKSNKFQSSEYMTLMAEGNIDSQTVANSYKPNKYSIDYNHPQTATVEDWVDEDRVTTSKSRKNKYGKANVSSNRQGNGKSTDKKYGKSKSQYPAKKYGNDKSTSKGYDKPNDKDKSSAYDKPKSANKGKVDKTKSNKYLAECLEYVNRSVKANNNQHSSKSKSSYNSKRKTRSESSNTVDNGVAVAMPPVKRKSNKGAQTNTDNNQ